MLRSKQLSALCFNRDLIHKSAYATVRMMISKGKINPCDDLVSFWKASQPSTPKMWKNLIKIIKTERECCEIQKPRTLLGRMANAMWRRSERGRKKNPPKMVTPTKMPTRQRLVLYRASIMGPTRAVGKDFSFHSCWNKFCGSSLMIDVSQASFSAFKFRCKTQKTPKNRFSRASRTWNQVGSHCGASSRERFPTKRDDNRHAIARLLQTMPESVFVLITKEMEKCFCDAKTFNRESLWGETRHLTSHKALLSLARWRRQQHLDSSASLASCNELWNLIAPKSHERDFHGCKHVNVSTKGFLTCYSALIVMPSHR